jgi:membrane fusion protein, multidrug efflux system
MNTHTHVGQLAGSSIAPFFLSALLTTTLFKTTHMQRHNTQAWTLDKRMEPEARLKDAKVDLSRAEAYLEDAKAQREDAKAHVARAEAHVARAEADLDDAKAQLARAEAQWIAGGCPDTGMLSENFQSCTSAYSAAHAGVSAARSRVMQREDDARSAREEVVRAQKALDERHAGTCREQTRGGHDCWCFF